MTKIKSDFALLDVKKGRKKLRETSPPLPLPVVILGTVNPKPWGNDDGVSQEFELTITTLQTNPIYTIVPRNRLTFESREEAEDYILDNPNHVLAVVLA